jgi:hypothetical protein
MGQLGKKTGGKFEVALVLYDDNSYFDNLRFDRWAETVLHPLVSCGIVLGEDEKWLQLLSNDNFSYRYEDFHPQNRVDIILKKAIVYEKRFEVSDCEVVMDLLGTYQNMKEEQK